MVELAKKLDALEAQNKALQDKVDRLEAAQVQQSVVVQQQADQVKQQSVKVQEQSQVVQKVQQEVTCIRIDHSSYAARPAAIGSRVVVRLFEKHVEIRARHTLALLRTHPRAQRPGSVLLPDDERPFNPSRETRSILAQAREIGAAALTLCENWFAQDGRVGHKKLRGVVGLAKRYPRRLIDQACTQALAENVRSYQSIKALTERLLAQALAEIDAPVQGELALEQEHPLIRAGGDYADLFARAAQASAATSNDPETPAP